MLYIFAYNICFQIYAVAHILKAKRCFFGGMRNQRYGKTAFRNLRYRQADTVNRNTALFDDLFHKLWRGVDSHHHRNTLRFAAGNYAKAFHVSADDVTVKTVAQAQRALQIYSVAGMQAADIG